MMKPEKLCMLYTQYYNYLRIYLLIIIIFQIVIHDHS